MENALAVKSQEAEAHSKKYFYWANWLAKQVTVKWPDAYTTEKVFGWWYSCAENINSHGAGIKIDTCSFIFIRLLTVNIQGFIYMIYEMCI